MGAPEVPNEEAGRIAGRRFAGVDDPTRAACRCLARPAGLAQLRPAGNRLRRPPPARGRRGLAAVREPRHWADTGIGAVARAEPPAAENMPAAELELGLGRDGGRRAAGSRGALAMPGSGRRAESVPFNFGYAPSSASAARFRHFKGSRPKKIIARAAEPPRPVRTVARPRPATRRRARASNGTRASRTDSPASARRRAP